MGDVADDMIEGLCCSNCLTYFKRAHGFPVLCKECRKGVEDEDKTLPEATEEEIG